jgi:hypothetical protein
MRTITKQIYSFSELSDKAKIKAIDNYRAIGYEPAWAKENEDTLNKFAEIFPVNIKSWSYGDRGECVRFTFTANSDIEELTGQRLATYLWNNYKTSLYKGKYYSLWSKTEKSYQYYKEGYPVLKQRYSKVILENSCVLTGYCIDDDILQPVYDFMSKPTNINFKELIEDCFSAWVKACNADVEDQNSYESIADIFEGNNYEFLENGEIFND